MKTLIKSIVIAASILISGCGNLDMIDLNFTFDRALVHWPDGSMKEIKIRQWRDYQGEQLQLIGQDGKIYLVSSFNTVLIRE